MSETAWDDTKSEKEVQENMDQAVEDVKDLDFATLEEVKEAFRQSTTPPYCARADELPLAC